jgi:hypothetical protein
MMMRWSQAQRLWRKNGRCRDRCLRCESVSEALADWQVLWVVCIQYRREIQCSAMQCLYNALIRTHHITSRKKVAKLKQSAAFHDVFVLLRSGGPPGVMYVEGQKDGVAQWVSDVKVS